MSEDAEPQKPKRRGLTAAERMAQWRLRHQTKPFPPLLAPSIKLDRLAASAKETLAVYDRLVKVIGNGLNKLGSAVTPGANAAPAGSPMQDNQPSGGILSKLFGGGAVPA